MKRTFELDKNSAYDDQVGSVSIIGQAPEDKPYLSIQIMDESGLIAHTWVKDKDLERLAVNILKALKSRKLNYTNP